MGIRDVWNILAPFSKREPLYTLEGQAIAIDLACWVVGAQTVGAEYLSNVFFRTAQLLTLNVYPVFVLEGKAPTLKYNTIAERNVKIGNGKGRKDRHRFRYVLKKCEKMLNYMGLKCVTGVGEAEAMCAYLNAKGLVSGVISQDSDCFAYGARIVYRNYSKEENKIDVYNLKTAENLLSIGRNKIIAIALFLGSDYNKGVERIGSKSVINFLNDFKDHEIIDRIRSWRTNPDYYNEWSEKVRDTSDRTMTEKMRSRMKNEIDMRSKALKDPSFPNEHLINEFLVDKNNIEELDLTWRRPNIKLFMEFISKNLSWNEVYTFKKLLPLLTYWQLKNYKLIEEKMSLNGLSELDGILVPNCIKCNRTLKGVLCYDILWEDKYKFYEDCIPEDQLNCPIETLWTTTEKVELIKEAYPNLIEAFEKGPRARKAKKREHSKQNRPNKKTRKAVDENKPQTGKMFFAAKTKVSQLKAAAKSDAANMSFDLNCSGFSEGDADVNDVYMSTVIDRIVSRPLNILQSIENLCAEQSIQLDSNQITVSKSQLENLVLQTSLQIVRNAHKSVTDSSRCCADADQLEKEAEQPEQQGNQLYLNDTFDQPYVPLINRIQKNIFNSSPP